jgi:uncharacterized membrane protein YgdD (TMEM256/DUF423 family)
VNNLFLRFATITGAITVIAGAMLAHLLKHQMTAPALEIYDTAIRYQFYHVFALLATGILSEKFNGPWINRAGGCFIAGIILFSGSLYIISAQMTIGSHTPTALGVCTPLGGLGFIMGWIFLTVAIWTGRSS